MFDSSRSLYFPRVLPTVLGLVCLSGCGGSVAPGDEGSVTAPILSLEDAAYNPKMFAQTFVQDAVPKNRGAYASIDIELAGEPKISGQSATVPVKLTIGGNVVAAEKGMSAPSPTAKKTVKTTWTVEKVGEAWKIAKAPLK